MARPRTMSGVGSAHQNAPGPQITLEDTYQPREDFKTRHCATEIYALLPKVPCDVTIALVALLVIRTSKRSASQPFRHRNARELHAESAPDQDAVVVEAWDLIEPLEAKGIRLRQSEM